MRSAKEILDPVPRNWVFERKCSTTPFLNQEKLIEGEPEWSVSAEMMMLAYTDQKRFSGKDDLVDVKRSETTSGREIHISLKWEGIEVTYDAYEIK